MYIIGEYYMYNNFVLKTITHMYNQKAHTHTHSYNNYALKIIG